MGVEFSIAIPHTGHQPIFSWLQKRSATETTYSYLECSRMNYSGFGRMLATMHYHLYTCPVEEGRAVVDIECRCHKNTANVDAERNKLTGSYSTTHGTTETTGSVREEKLLLLKWIM